MSAHHELQAQRYELKFIVPESLRTSIRAFVASYLELDEYAQDDYSYAIHSIYLDSPRLDMYHATLNGDRNRYKLRIRYYNDDANTPTFLETKRKVSDVVQKQRCLVSRASLPQVLAGDTSLIKPGSIKDQMTFCHLMHQANATPRAHVGYLREAWVSRHDNSIRVTMDRDVRVEPRFDLRLGTAMDNPVTVFPGQIVLELKYTNRYPAWFRDIVQNFNLMQCGAAKYAGGIMLYGEQRYLRAPELNFV